MTPKLVSRLKIAEGLVGEVQEKIAALEASMPNLKERELAAAVNQQRRNQIRLATLTKKLERLKAAQQSSPKEA